MCTHLIKPPSQLLFTYSYCLHIIIHSYYLHPITIYIRIIYFPPPFFVPVFCDGVRIRDPKHNFLAFPESVQKVVGSMLKIGQFFCHKIRVCKIDPSPTSISILYLTSPSVTLQGRCGKCKQYMSDNYLHVLFTCTTTIYIKICKQ